jgi:hypothetical protein
MKKMNSRKLSRLAIGTLTLLLVFPGMALAGPILICHVIDIGKASTLPAVDWNYRNGTAGYDLRNLSRDTLAILDSNPSVLVHMETLRRATILARQDPRAATELITRVQARSGNPDSTGHSQALAVFDLGYLAESYKQWISRTAPNPAAGVDGYAYVKKAIDLRGVDPEMEFAAAMITWRSPDNDHRDHLRKAVAGSKTDSLLAQNLAANFGSQTIADVLANTPMQASNK